MREFERRENESLLSYFKRVTDNRVEYDLDYTEWAKIVCNKDYSSDNARKSYYVIKPMLELLDEEIINKMPKNKIEEVKDIIGELDIKKIEVRNKTNQLNKIKRNFIKSIEIANDVKEFLLDEIDNFPQFEYEPLTVSDNKLVVQVSDWHVGYVINDYKGNLYNYEIAKKRLNKLIAEIEKYCDFYDISQVVVVNCGDIIENLYMRQNQSYECEFTLSQQISNATKLLFGFISELSKFTNVEVYSVGGNHNRMAQKDANVEGDNANVIITETLKTFVELSNNERIHIGDTDYKDDSCEFEINGLKFLAIHGDNRVSNGKKLFDSENVDVVLRGHYHNFNIESQDNGGYVITSGCLFGYNPYSIKKMSCKTNATQTIIVVGNKEIECIKDVNLQI